MIKIFTSTLVLFFCLAVNAQNYLNQPNLHNRPATKKVTFWDVEKAFNEYWSTRSVSETESENAEGGGWQQYKRWEWFVKQRTMPSGVFPNPEILYSEYKKYKQDEGFLKGEKITAANWSFIGPGVVPTLGGGTGRINCIAFQPGNSNIIYIGAACGGLWKSIDGGTTWSVFNTDLLPSISISDIVINPVNPNEMYLATGDKYGIYYQYETWGHYSAGVLKSTNGGTTWNQTGMNYSLANGVVIQRLILDSASTNTLMAATLQGIFRTTDGGTTWTNVKTGRFYDIEYHPTNHQIAYAADSLLIYRTTNGGTTWTSTGISCNGRSSIAVSRSFPNTVYVWAQNSLYYSNDGGVNFSLRTDPSSQATPYGYYDKVLEVSPVNENILFAGGLDIARSTNGGTSWTKVSNWGGFGNPDYVHADQKSCMFLPGSSTAVFATNDGGIFKSTDQGATWTDKSNGIDIKQYYRFSSSFLTPTLMVAGAQDNGTDKITGPTAATMVNGADGEDCLIDFTDDNIVFISTQGGQFKRSTNGGTSFNAVSVGGCDWTSPIFMDPNNHNVVYIGGSSLHKSTNNGVNWTSTSGFDGSCIYSIRVAPSNSSYVYVATFKHIYKSTNGGTSFTDITGTLPVSSAAITGIAINGTNPDAVWVCFSGFSAGNKTFYTNNGGTSWSNISGTLPNIPVNCIEYQNGSNDVVYIGTDLGVFYTDATLNNWVSYNTGLPNVIIDDMEVHYPTMKLRAATYGRGIWESDVQTTALIALDASAIAMVDPPVSTCDTVVTPKVRIRNAGADTLTSVKLNYKIDAQAIQVYNWAGTLLPAATADITLPSYTFTSGTHTLTAYTSNPNSLPDQNNINDTIRRTFTILANPAGMQAPIQEGFVSAAFPPVNWTLENSSGLLSRSTACGGYGSSSESMKADFLNIQNGTDMLESNYVSFSNLLPPIWLSFDLAYASYNTTYFDSMAVELYDDCSGISKRIFKDGYPGMSTAPPQTAAFVPNASQWRTDSINLDTMAGKPSMKIRFLAITDFGNNMYIDNINLTGTPLGISNPGGEAFETSVYPNPSSGMVAFRSNAPAVRIEVLNVLGEKMFSMTIRSGETGIDLSYLNSGIYYLRIDSEKGSAVKKLIINK